MADGSNTPNLTLSLIGDFELRRAGEPVRMAPSSQRLICYLALQNRTRRRSLVSSTLWLDSSEARANASLRSALWRVPAPAGEAVVSASNTHVWLNPRVRVDLHRVIERAYAVLDSTSTEMDMVNVARDLAAFGDDVLRCWRKDWGAPG